MALPLGFRLPAASTHRPPPRSARGPDYNFVQIDGLVGTGRRAIRGPPGPSFWNSWHLGRPSYGYHDATRPARHQKRLPLVAEVVELHARKRTHRIASGRQEGQGVRARPFE